MWLLYQKIVAVVVNIVLGFFLFFFFLNGSELFGKLYISDEESTDTNMAQNVPQASPQNSATPFQLKTPVQD